MAINGRKVLLMAQDEGKFGIINTPRKAWVPRNIRPIVSIKLSRDYFYVFAAVCPQLGTIVSLILPYANSDMMNIFLEEVSTTYPDYFIIMQLDQAGWHRSKDLHTPENIRFIYQPAYSPQLNPTEHCWDELREKYLTNQQFENIDEVSNAVITGLKSLGNLPEQVPLPTFRT